MRMRFLLIGTFGFALFGSSLIALALAQQSVASSLVADGPGNTPVVAAALTMTPYLYNCPPEQLDQCYTSGFPQAAIAFWQRTCPGCRAWQNGDLQCVMLVTAAYGLAGQQLPAVGNAIDFWSLYHSRPGWTEIPSGSGAPLPGDMMVLSSPYFGGGRTHCHRGGGAPSSERPSWQHHHCAGEWAWRDQHLPPTP